MNVAGVIEGFYGPPWTHDERPDLIRCCGANGLNAWVYGPKDDPYHRARDPASHEPVASFEQALREQGAEVVEALGALAPGVDVGTGAALEPFV